MAKKKQRVRQRPTVNESYPCSVCPRIFKRKNTLALHKKRHDACRESFVALSELESHRTTPSTEEGKPATVVEQAAPLRCEACDKSFPDATRLRRHVYRHERGNRFQCDHCSKQLWSRAELLEHRRRHTGDKPFECDVCLRRFARRGELRAHERTCHTMDRPFVCHLCPNRAYLNRPHLERHLQTHAIRPYRCRFCSSGFATAEALRTHERARHFEGPSADRPHVCGVCDAHFKTKVALVRHRLVHSDERPHVCSECDRRFRQPAHLLYHMRTHSSEATSRKPHECGVCLRTFASRQYVEKHLRAAHAGPEAFQCGYNCGVVCETRDEMRRHNEARHASPLPQFECHVCDTSYTRKCDLDRHQTTHEALRPSHRCPNCRKTFSKKGNFVNHVRTVCGSLSQFRCLVCLKRFSSREALHVHGRGHTDF